LTSSTRFFASLVVEALGQLTLFAGLSDHQRKLRRKRHTTNLLASAIKKNGVISATEE
jgi:hypothetical protein